MIFELNSEKSPFCTIGPFSFSFAETVHEIDVDQLPDQYKQQLLYNVNRGVLETDDKKGLKALAQAMQPVTPIPQEQIPIKMGAVTKMAKSLTVDPIKADLKPLRALLRQGVASVKKIACDLSPGRLRKLLELEMSLKKRKGVISFLEKLLDKHELSVTAAIGSGDDIIFNQLDPHSRSTQVSDIVESDVEVVTFTQGDIEEENLVLSPEVMSQLEE